MMPPAENKKRPVSGDGQVNQIPPHVGMGPEVANPVTGLGKGTTGAPAK